MSERMLTVKDIAKMMNVSRATAYRLCSNLPMVRVGKALRISPEAFARTLKTYGGEIPTHPVSKEGDGDG